MHNAYEMWVKNPWLHLMEIFENLNLFQNDIGKNLNRQVKVVVMQIGL